MKDSKLVVSIVNGDLTSYIEYKGYKIQSERDPWALKYNMNFRYFIDEEKIRHGKTIEECKQCIDEETFYMLE